MKIGKNNNGFRFLSLLILICMLVTLSNTVYVSADESDTEVFGDDTDHVKGFKFFPQYKDYNEIGEVLAGRDPGRKSQDQRIIDYNYGLALHDVVFASKIYEMVADRHVPSVEIVKETDKFWV